MNRKLINIPFLSGTLAAMAFFAAQASSHAATILNFSAFPVSPGAAEIAFSNPGTGLTLHAGPGATGNGDGGLPTPVQTSGGLLISTPFTITDPTTLYGRQNNLDGSTSFYDVTLVLSGIVPQGNAQKLGSLVFQGFSGGTFGFYGSQVGGGLGALLLGGTLNDTSANGLDGSGTGATLDDAVAYTGGAIYNALVAAGGMTSGPGNEMSISLTDINPKISYVANQPLAPFTANATGLFSTTFIPEPASLSLLVVSAAAVGLRRRR